MKKVFAFAMALCLLICCMAGCSSTGSASKKGTLKVAMSPDFAPMEFMDMTKTGQDQYVGFDVSLAKFIASEMGKELEILPMSFDACQTAVATGKVDMAISGFSWMPEREENYNLSDYYQAGDNETEQVLITLASNGDKFATAEALAGHKVGAQTASLQEGLCESQLPDCEIVPVGDITTGLLQLEKGDFDVMAVAAGNARAIIASNPQYAMSGFEFEVDPKMTDNLILLKKGADELTAQVNEILAKAKAAGYYETWYNEALETAGVDVSFDDDGNMITD